MASREPRGKGPLLTIKEVWVTKDPLHRGALDRVLAALREAAEPRRHRQDPHPRDVAEARARRELASMPGRRDGDAGRTDER